jgi:cation diffusion facilitator CzcD-associated flavoprotein CzcO
VSGTTSRRPTVAILGAGAGGIAMGIKLRRAGYDFTIYEKSDGVGGTWRDNA